MTEDYEPRIRMLEERVKHLEKLGSQIEQLEKQVGQLKTQVQNLMKESSPSKITAEVNERLAGADYLGGGN
jgi:phage shock protein A